MRKSLLYVRKIACFGLISPGWLYFTLCICVCVCALCMHACISKGFSAVSSLWFEERRSAKKSNILCTTAEVHKEDIYQEKLAANVSWFFVPMRVEGWMATKLNVFMSFALVMLGVLRVSSFKTVCCCQNGQQTNDF